MFDDYGYDEVRNVLEHSYVPGMSQELIDMVIEITKEYIDDEVIDSIV